MMNRGEALERRDAYELAPARPQQLQSMVQRIMEHTARHFSIIVCETHL